ncbi:MAG: tryptophan 7-halogenase [Verrucomicrobiales bacterium]|nr:tryptophan 7-halogenase [Verrucomicrobiales bacterium]
MNQLVEKIIVLGGGSAGFLAAITMKKRMPHLNVSVIHSSKIPIIGVGEGTTFTMPQYLHGYLGLNPGAFHQLVRPTYKLGIRFLWGPRERFHYTFKAQLDGRLANLPKANGFYCMDDFRYTELNASLMENDKGFERQSDGGPMVNTDVAYHLENAPFVEFLEKAAREVGVLIIDDEVKGVDVGEEGISTLHLESGGSESADLYIDCSGFRSELLGKALDEPFIDYSSSLFCDRAIAGGWERSDEVLKPYTTAETMDAGWAWQIEHDHLINRGYVFSSSFLSDDEAEAEFKKKNPKIEDPRLIKFTSGAYERNWVKNVVALGNASGFVEPLEATSLAVTCEHAAKLVQTLADSDMRIHPVSRRYYNHLSKVTWDAIRRFLAMHYKFNTRLDTPFWKACHEDTNLAGADEIMEYYQSSGPGLMWSTYAMGANDPFGWEGYLVMLVGQKVKHEANYQAGENEKMIFEQYRNSLKRRSENALTMRESLDMIRSNKWQWKPDFYPNASPWGS